MVLNTSEIVMLRAESISFGFSEEPIFDNWSDEFDVGITWVKGGNGVGKSTLLKLLGGALNAQSGSIQLGQFGSTSTPIEFRKRAFLCNGDLPHLPWLRTGELIDLFVSLYSPTDREIVFEHLKAFNLHALENEPVNTLSLGQYKKLMLSIALSVPVSVLLLDEPFNALDKSALVHLQSTLTDPARLSQQIIVLASHIDPYLPIKKEIQLSQI